MLTTVTEDTFAEFIHTFSQQIIAQKKVVVEISKEEDLYINSPEYLSGPNSRTYDMTNPLEQEKFFADLKNG